MREISGLQAATKTEADVRSRSFAGPAILLMAAAVAVVPLVVRGPSCGDDFAFHVSSWLEAQNAWRHGIPYPHWANGPNFGAGEPRFVFYPPLIWMLGAALGLILPWSAVPVAITFLLLAATGLATRRLAQEMLPDAAAALAGCTAIFFGYGLYSAYERTAFAELSGGFWIPLLLLFLLRNRACWPLALVVAGAWLSNAPLGVMACYLMAAVALVLALLAKSWIPIVRAAIAAVLGIGLAAIYLLPAAMEQRWVAIQHATGDPGMRIEDNWLFERLANPLVWWHDRELLNASLVTVVMIALALVSALFLYARRDRQTSDASQASARLWWIPLALIPAVVLLLQFPISLPVWNALPKLRFLQFPWRWLVVVEAPMAIFFAAAVWTMRPRWRRVALALGVGLFLVSTAIAGRSFYIPCGKARSLETMLGKYSSGQGIRGTVEYFPLDAAPASLATGLTGSCLVNGPLVPWQPKSEDASSSSSTGETNCDQTFPLAPVQAQDGEEHFAVSGVADRSGYLILHLLRYPAWRVMINGQTVTSLPLRDDGLIAVPVPRGVMHLSVDWTTSNDVVAGRWISIVCVVLIAGLWGFERKRNAVRLS
jgi:hypothetical protein